jgi:hypothetical protein
VSAVFIRLFFQICTTFRLSQPIGRVAQLVSWFSIRQSFHASFQFDITVFAISGHDTMSQQIFFSPIILLNFNSRQWVSHILYKASPHDKQLSWFFFLYTLFLLFSSKSRGMVVKKSSRNDFLQTFKKRKILESRQKS